MAERQSTRCDAHWMHAGPRNSDSCIAKPLMELAPAHMCLGKVFTSSEAPKVSERISSSMLSAHLPQ